MKLTLKSAKMEDAETLFAWQSHKSTRRYFKQKAIPTLNEHLRWFKETLENEDIEFLVGEVEGELVGSLRLDQFGCGKTEHMISIVVAPEFRGTGIGSLMIREAQLTYQGESLCAEVNSQNIPSVKMFEKCAFVYSNSRGFYVWKKT